MGVGWSGVGAPHCDDYRRQKRILQGFSGFKSCWGGGEVHGLAQMVPSLSKSCLRAEEENLLLCCVSFCSGYFDVLLGV